MRKVGKILLDLEPLLDILALVKAYLEIHRPGCIEEYTDGTNPEYYYGPKK
jgi:hypothetical protein